MEHILITGGTGTIGRALAASLRAKKHKVSILTRSPRTESDIYWDPKKMELQEGKLGDVTIIIHLAGAGIADQRWTNARKKEIIDSRVQSALLLEKYLAKGTHKLKHFISSSAVGYYSDRGDKLMHETDAPQHDFLSNSCIAWEHSIDNIGALGIPITKLRTGVVLDLEGGALPKMIIPTKLGIGSALGTGKQWMSWIHMDDLVELYCFIMEQKLLGIYNGVAPEPVQNVEFARTLSKVLHRPFFFPAVPSFLLKLIFGEMAAVVLGSTRVSSEKIQSAGFRFKFPTLELALRNLLID
jgi:hypothetical protein